MRARVRISSNKFEPAGAESQALKTPDWNAAMRALCVIGILDSLLLMIAPKIWQAFWIPKLDKLASAPKAAVCMGMLEFSLSVWLYRELTKSRSSTK